MVELFFGLPIFVLSAGLLFRLMLVLSGLHKGPLLALFEKYGDEENHLYPIPRLAFWFGTLCLSGYIAFYNIIFMPVVVVYIGLVLLLAAYLYVFWLPAEVRYKTGDFPPVPTWYHNLRQRTSRAERRRIAYMWLRLPWRARLTYNSNNRAFFAWADLVIMGTVN